MNTTPSAGSTRLLESVHLSFQLVRTSEPVARFREQSPEQQIARPSAARRSSSEPERRRQTAAVSTSSLAFQPELIQTSPPAKQASTPVRLVQLQSPTAA